MSERPPNVLALTCRADFGGGPEHLYQLARQLGQDLSLTIACPIGDAPYGGRFARLLGKGNVIPLPHRRFELGALWRLAGEVRRRDIEVIHSHGKGAGLYGRLLGMMTGRPVVHTYHGLHVAEYSPRKKAAYLALERFLSRFTRAVICVSEGEKEALKMAQLAPERKLHVIENGVHIPPAKQREKPRKRLRIIAVSRFDHQKNAEETLQIATHLKRLSKHKVSLTILGEGPGRAALLSQIAEQGLGDVISCPGAVLRPRRHMRRADVILSTSRWEGMPIAVLEAMSEGLCPVLSDVIGNADVVHDGMTGRLFPLGDPEAAARLILSLGRGQRRRLGTAAQAHVSRRYSVERMARMTAALYQRALPPARRSPATILPQELSQ